jgi:hypothetical protein
MRRSASDGRLGRRTDGRAVIVTLLMLSVCPSAPLPAQSDASTLTSGALFLLLPVGARTTAMGQAGSADGGSGELAFSNPAGLAHLERGEFGLHHGRIIAGETDAVSVFFPSRRLGVLGAAVYLVDYGDLELTDSAGVVTGRLSPRNIELLASYATTVNGAFALGVTYKLVQLRVDCGGSCTDVPAASGVTHALDVGAQLRLGGPLRFGVVLRNLGAKLQVNNREQADPLPTRILVGALYQLPLTRVPTTDSLGLPGSLVGFDLRVALDVENSVGNYNEPETRVGVDLGYGPWLRLRGGYAFLNSTLRGASVGVGLEAGAVTVDLARTFFAGNELAEREPLHVSFRLAF